MVTKSKNDWSFIASIIAIMIAVVSIGYCLPSVVEMIGNGWERSTRAVTYIARLMKGASA